MSMYNSELVFSEIHGSYQPYCMRPTIRRGYKAGYQHVGPEGLYEGQTPRPTGVNLTTASTKITANRVKPIDTLHLIRPIAANPSQVVTLPIYLYMYLSVNRN